MSMTAAREPEADIRTVQRPCCPVCSSPGAVVYSDQADRLFGAPGLWKTKRCTIDHCGTLWLDPAPDPEDLGKLYAQYYTHTASQNRWGKLRRMYVELQRNHVSRRFGYAPPSHSNVVSSLAARLLFLVPSRRLAAEDGVRFLKRRGGGKLLDVGCGAGTWLRAMQNLGWKAHGVDFDENAVAAARGLGLSVRVGTVSAAEYPGEEFDAITLNHVIEHVPDPAQLLRECMKLLAPDGQLYVATPNARSLGHAVFGACWRGLEPPRHLQLFTRESLSQLLSEVGLFPEVFVTCNSRSVWQQSLEAWSKMRSRALRPNRLRSLALTAVAEAVITFAPRRGEFLLVLARKGPVATATEPRANQFQLNS